MLIELMVHPPGAVPPGHCRPRAAALRAVILARVLSTYPRFRWRGPKLPHRSARAALAYQGEALIFMAERQRWREGPGAHRARVRRVAV